MKLNEIYKVINKGKDLKKYKEFAWRKIYFQIPADWNMALESGSSKNGYFRVDDRYRPRLEIKWENIPFEKAPQSRKIIENFLEDFKKKIKKRRIKIDLKVVSIRELNVSGHEASLFYLKGVEDSLLISWYCEKEERGYIMQISFKSSEYNEMKKIINNILSSIRCHFNEEYIPWILYGFKIKIPREYELISRKFTSGFSYLDFRKKNFHIIFGYSSMANILLEEYYKDISDWYRNLFWKETIKKIGSKFKVKYEKPEKTIINQHEAIIFNGASPGFLKRFKLYLRSFLWKCDIENRIYCFTTIHKGIETPKEFSSILISLKCH